MPKRDPEYMQNQRLRFCEAAITCFSRKGIASTNLPEICAEIGLTMGAFYKHFTSRDELLAATLDLRLTRRNEQVQGTTWREFRLKILEYRRSLDRTQYWNEFNAMCDWNPDLAAIQIRQGRIAFKQIEQQLIAYKAAGEIDPMFDCARTARLISLIVNGSLAGPKHSDLIVSIRDLGKYLDFAVGAVQLSFR